MRSCGIRSRQRLGAKPHLSPLLIDIQRVAVAFARHFTSPHTASRGTWPVLWPGSRRIARRTLARRVALQSLGTRDHTHGSTAQRLPIYAVILGGLVLTAMGGATAFQLVRHGREAQSAGHVGAGADDASANASTLHITTSFGRLTIEGVQEIAGHDMGSQNAMMQGIPGYIGPGQMQVQAFVTLSNATGHTIACAPNQFQLVYPNEAQPQTPSSASLPASLLRPRTNVTGTVSFIVPAGTKDMVLQYRDPDSGHRYALGLDRLVDRHGTSGDGGHANHAHP